jgi:uncharacterized alkaline shock family protein YloU
MAVNARVSPHGLPCGRSVEELVDEVDAGRTSQHSLRCEHCATAERSLRQLSEATVALVDDEPAPPPGLLDKIMRAVRAEIRRGDVVDMPGEFGPVQISEQAIAVVLRYAADTVTGVRARRCHVEVDDEDPEAVSVLLALSLRYGVGPAEDLIAAVRARISAALSGQIGVRASAVDLVLEDVWEDG